MSPLWRSGSVSTAIRSASSTTFSWNVFSIGLRAVAQTLKLFEPGIRNFSLPWL
jgi:hypothetical protein